MKKLVLAASIASMLSGAAFAAKNLDSGAGDAGTYANEITISGATTLTRGAAADQTATATFGASFATDAVAYVRFDLSGGATFVGSPTFDINDNTVVADTAPAVGAGNAVVSIAQGGAGQSFVVFAVAPNAVGNNLASAKGFTFRTGTGISIAAKGSVEVTYKLFETLTNAANDTLPLKTASSVFTSFSNALSIAAGSSVTRTADVASTGGAYRRFVSNSVLESLNSFTVTHTPRSLLTGVASAAADILAATNSVTISGDFAARTTPAAPATGVTLNSQADCLGASVNATAVSSSAATFGGLSAAGITANTWYVCYNVTGATAIPESTYVGAIDLVGNAGFTPADGSTGGANIVRNGTVLKAAFAEASTVSGTASAISLTNTSSSAAPFSVRCLTSGTPVTGTPGSVPANSSGRFAIVSALGCPAGVRGIELTFAVPQGSVIGSVVRQNLTTGVASFDGMVGNQ